jgi:hypothetical protein
MAIQWLIKEVKSMIQWAKEDQNLGHKRVNMQAVHMNGIAIDCRENGDEVAYPIGWGAVSDDGAVHMIEFSHDKALPIQFGKEYGLDKVHARTGPMARPHQKFFNW